MSRNTVVARVPSLTTSGVSYRIRRRGGRLECECPLSATFGKECSHVRIAAKALALLDRCATSHHDANHGAVCLGCVTALMAQMARRVRREYVSKAKLKQLRADRAAAKKLRRERRLKERNEAKT